MRRILIGGFILMIAAFGFQTFAFHSGGVAECEGCHSIHNPASSSFLLKSATKSGTCLSCHDNTADTTASSYHISTSDAGGGTGVAGKLPVQASPGGDFGWLKRTYSWTENGELVTENNSHGHNIVAPEYGYDVDPDFTTGPGGSFLASDLACASCHDPHGGARRLSDGTYAATGAPIIGSGSYNNSADPAAGQAVGVYRILFTGVSTSRPPNTNFTTVPVAVAPSTYNRYEGTTQTRVAYGGGNMTNSWGAWCGSCHGTFNTMNKSLKHPIDVPLGSVIATNYHDYVSSGIMDPANPSPYLSLVPFAENTESIATLKTHAKNDDTVLSGPSTSDAVTCLSCHRAHASGFAEMLRYYYSWEFMTFNGNYPGLDNPSMTSSRKAIQAGGRNMADFQRAYYERPASKFGTYNRVLCNKCHAQD